MFKPDYFIDMQWLHKVAYKLEGFKKASGRTYNARCPYCGDSEKSKRKQRFYFYTKKDSLNFDCKNCSASGSFWTFMVQKVPEKFEEYKKEQMLKNFKRFKQPKMNEREEEPVVQEEPEEKCGPVDLTKLIGIIEPLDSLPDNHKAKKYMMDRAFTEKEMSRLFYAEDFKKVSKVVSYKEISEHFPNEPRIVIPFFNKKGELIMMQGRSLDPKSKLKYITIKTDPDLDKVYGLETLNTSKTSYCVEGPLDSLFVDNCLATCDSSLTKVKADVYIFDNQPRNREIVELMEQCIEAGHSLVIWPNSPSSKEDINDMIKNGLSQKELMKIIKERTFKGLKAKIEFTKWKRVY